MVKLTTNDTYTKKPKMVLFDVGGTLFEGGKFSQADGLEALRLVAINPDVATTAELVAAWDEFSREVGSSHKSVSGFTLDFPLSAQLKYVTMKSGLKFDISVYEQEEIFDRFNSTRKVIDGLTGLLETLENYGIRAAVISNNAMSGEGLALAVRHWIPTGNFEFCLTSADIMLAKPCDEIFITAANFASLDPSECWYCGDSFLPDVEGSLGAGMSPILLDRKSQTPLEIRKDCDKGDYMAINHWDNLTQYIRNTFEQ